MSHDPSSYRPPPQGRWPQATPPVPWPSYREGDVYRGGAVYRGEEHLDGQYATDQPVSYPAAVGYAHQRDSAGYGGPGYAPPEYHDTRDRDAWGARNGYGRITDGFDGAPGHAIAPAGYPYPGRGGYAEPARSEPAPPPPPRPVMSRPSGALLTAPDAGLRQDRWQAAQDRRRAAAQRGRAVGAWTGLLAVEAAIGVSTLAAAFVRPQAAPVIAVGDVFIARVPAGLKNVAMTHFGSHGRIVLLIGMYLAIACLALGMGALSRRAAALGVTGLAAFALLSAFVVITRPTGRATDVIPAVIGGVAGIAALLWLQRVSGPVAPGGPDAPGQAGHGGSRPGQAGHGGSRRSR